VEASPISRCRSATPEIGNRAHRRGHNRPRSHVWPLITQTPSSPVSSTVKIVIPLTVTRFTANHVSSLRRQWNIPRFEPPATLPEGELRTVKQAGRGPWNRYPSTIHRWLNDGFIGGEQLTPGAPWRIRLTEDLRDGFVNEAPKGFITAL